MPPNALPCPHFCEMIERDFISQSSIGLGWPGLADGFSLYLEAVIPTMSEHCLRSGKAFGDFPRPLGKRPNCTGSFASQTSKAAGSRALAGEWCGMTAGSGAHVLLVHVLLPFWLCLALS